MLPTITTHLRERTCSSGPVRTSVVTVPAHSCSTSPQLGPASSSSAMPIPAITRRDVIFTSDLPSCWCRTDNGFRDAQSQLIIV